MPLRNITYRGKNIRYRNVATLARRLRITVDQANQLINDQDTEKIFVSSTGDVLKFDVNDNPLFLQDFNIQKISNKKLLKPSYKIKKNFIVNEVQDKFVKLIVSVSFEFEVSVEIVRRRKSFTIQTSSNEDDIKGNTMEKIEEYVMTIDNAVLDTIVVDWNSLNIKSEYSNQQLELVDNKLRDAVPLELFYENIDTEKYKDCVRDFLKKKYKKLSKKYIDSLGDENGVSTNEIKEFCIKYTINLIAYDVNGNVIAKYIPFRPKGKKHNHPSLIYIAHNNHLYPLKNKYLHSIKSKKNVVVENATKKMIEFIKQKQEPSNIKVMQSLDVQNPDRMIKSFQIGSTTYLENDEYDKCYNILKSFGIEEQIHPFISLKNIGSIIERLYSANYNNGGTIESFFPQFSKFIKGGFNYNSIRESYDDCVTIDKNKCYSYCLRNLPFLISLDYRQSKIIEHNKYLSHKDITKHHLYIVKPKKSSILIPDTNAYSGDHLLFCLQQGLEIYCLEEITTEKHENYLSKLVHDIFQKVDKKDAKFILNVFIGKFERQQEEKNFVVTKLCNEEESKTVSGYKTKIGDTGYYLIESEETSYHITNRKPISIQIKDFSRVVLYNKMIELNIKQEDIIKIKTDSISFIDKDDIMRKINLNDSYMGWKQEEFEPPKTGNNALYKNGDLSFKLDKILHGDQITKYYNCYAGVGKTYHIINKLIPKLDDYIVLTPSHSTLLEYRTNNFNCDVIQKYEYSKTIPKENNIIVDECFLCSKKAHDIIYKCIISGKNVFIFGDDKQLLPPRESEQFSNKFFYNAFFKKHKQLKTNRRNDFTIDYYNELINDKYNNYKLVKEHEEKDYKKADTIICYRNDTRQKYNKLMLKHLGFKDKFQVGVKLICKTNDLRQKDIYNNFEFVIKKITKKQDDIVYTLDKDVTITHKQLDKYFVPAYAKTAYGVQGKSLKSYHYAKEDKFFLKDNNRLSYTIISRIKTK